MTQSEIHKVREVVITSFGGTEVLKLRERERVHPGPSQLLIKTVSCGVNPIDAKIRAGRNFVCDSRKGDPFPWTLGFDAAGIVLESAPGSKFAVGDRVVGNAGSPIHPCAYATETLLDESLCIKVPDDVDLKQAGALPTAALTALSIIALMPASAKHVLVAGGAGGVGHLLVRYLLALKFNVTATCSALNLQFLKALGVASCYDYHEALPSDCVGSFDVVVDFPGGKEGIALYRYLKVGGLMITVPTITEKEVMQAAPHGIEATGVRCVKSEENYVRMMEYAQQGIMPYISEELPLSEVVRAHELIASGHTRGKIILIP